MTILPKLALIGHTYRTEVAPSFRVTAAPTPGGAVASARWSF